AIPVLFTRVEYDSDGISGGLFVRKIPALRRLVAGDPLGEIMPEVAPGDGEIVVVKQYASAFFGTSLAATLRVLDVDMLIIAGVSTSGCVRATAVDALQHGFVPLVVRQAVGDRDPGPHEAALFDLQAKYAEVVDESAVLAWLSTGKPVASPLSWITSYTPVYEIIHNPRRPGPRAALKLLVRRAHGGAGAGPHPQRRAGVLAS
ncbi:MAG: isochorismatase family protein, partial [Trebonia sp.]